MVILPFVFQAKWRKKMEEKEGRERNALAQENEYFTVSLLILKIVMNDNTENGKVVTDIKNYCMMLYFETAKYY